MRTYPTGHATLTVTIPLDGGRARIDLAGPTTAPELRTPDTDVDLVGVWLQPWALGSVAGRDAAELCDRTIPFEELAPTTSSWAERLAGQTTAAASRFVTTQLPLSITPARASLARLALDGLETGEASAAQLAARVGLGRRQFERIIASQTGLTTTRLRLVRRLHRAVGLLRAGTDPSTTAHAAGFADQAHLTRSMRTLVGLTPASLRRERCAEHDVVIVQDSGRA